ncbi:MAG: rod shape-determining protein MreD [Bacteroidota bacterium]
MKINFLIYIFRFIALILLQVLILNNVQFSGYINPFVYILFIITLPFDTNPSFVMALGFILGISIDMFSNTMGMHTTATVLMCFVRPAFIRLLIPKNDFDAFPSPTHKELGLNRFLSFSIFLTLVHHFALFYIEVFKISYFFSTFFRAITSSIFTILLIIFIQYLFSKKK